MIYFTSDTHYDHANVIKYSNRPFQHVTEMNEIMIRNNNAIVKSEDTVYHLGDFCFSKDLVSFKRRLIGNYIHLKGNHDQALDKAKIPYLLYHEIADQNTIVHGRPVKICLFHYPIAVWNKKHYGSFCCHGHSHSNYKYSYPQSKKHGKIMDVGVDAVAKILGGKKEDYRPVSLTEVVAWMSKLEDGEALDHHSEDGKRREL